MNPEEKSKELVDKFLPLVKGGDLYDTYYNKAKECALISVDEIINALYDYDDNTETFIKEEFGLDYFSCEVQNISSDIRYWNKVKTELLKL